MRCRRPLIVTSLVMLVALSLLAAGCGGGGSPGVSSAASSTTAQQNGALAFAQCMRSHGLPDWPDPNSSGEFDKSKLRHLRYSVSRVRAVGDGACNHLLVAPSTGPTITLADRADYLKAAACMRSHGLPDFPDPTFASNTVQTDIPSSINQDSSTFRSAASICTKLIPAGLPYSRSSAP
jgi:hypothetical protein